MPTATQKQNHQILNSIINGNTNTDTEIRLFKHVHQNGMRYCEPPLLKGKWALSKQYSK